ncbi:hypothetical protein [Mycobacterium sp. DL440]|uniref:hypothetical protein n=1 Tax=Mycobacterium sp. DL440 TaxID=2675523 RepID=UPI00141FB23B|nr:hypothetical protein [Mycobacterium sp. DL440]
MNDLHSVRAKKLAPTGIALVGASAIALSPLAVPPSAPHLDIHNISSAAGAGTSSGSSASSSDASAGTKSKSDSK